MAVTTETNPIETQYSIAKEIIQKGLDNEYRISILSLDKIINQWKRKKLENSDAYFKLVHNLILSDKNIARRYDHISPEDYALVIASQLVDGFVKKEDLAELSDEFKVEILACINPKK